MKFHLAILKNENDVDHLPWVEACENISHKVSYEIITFTSNDWWEQIEKSNADAFLASPSNRISYYKQLYDERIFSLNNAYNKLIYPTPNELYIYENKRMLSYWLKSNKVSHLDTYVFYSKDTAREFCENTPFPVVAKTSIGAGGSGVDIIKSKEQLVKYIDKAFSKDGISRYYGPNLRKGNITSRTINRLKNPIATLNYFKNKKSISTVDPHRYHVILQKFMQIDFEWRMVRIGDSFFGHKKLRSLGEKISGSSHVSWDIPPEKLLNFVKEVTDKQNFVSQAVDVFEDTKGNYYVNELQCIFGSKNPHQMIKDGVPGRFRFINSNWIFEEGEFNLNNSFNLRLENIVEILEKKQV